MINISKSLFFGRMNRPIRILFIVLFVSGNYSLHAQPAYQRGIVSQFDSPVKQNLISSKIAVFEFDKTYFGKLLLPVATLQHGDTLNIKLGEKMIEGRIDRSPGGTIRYYSFTYIRKPGDPDTLILPDHRDKRNTSGNAIQLPQWVGTVMPFRAVEIELYNSSKMLIPARQFFHYRYNDQLASFKSSDTVLNKIWDLCKHTIKATSFAGLYIDGDRERIPYEADALINQLSHYAVDSVYEMARNTIDYLFMHPTWPTEWHLQMHQMVWYDHLFTGNKELISKYYELLKLKTLVRLAGPNGLISTTRMQQPVSFLDSLHYKSFDAKDVLRDITDWPQRGNHLAGPEYKGEADGFVFCDYNSVVNAFHYRSLVLMQKFAKILNQGADEKFFGGRAEQVRRAFEKVFVDPVSGLVKDGDTTTHSSAHANFFALCFGLLDEEKQEPVLDYIVIKEMACSVYGSQFLLDALYESGRGDDAFRLLTSRSDRSWFHMIEVGAGMTTEAWDIKFKPNQDWNHAWGAAPANLIAFRLMGIRPLEPGYEKVMIDPQPGNLQFASITIPTPMGSIHEEIQRNGEQVSITVQLPKGMKYELGRIETNKNVKLRIVFKNQP